MLWAQGAQGQDQKGYPVEEGRRVRVGHWGHVPATAWTQQCCSCGSFDLQLSAEPSEMVLKTLGRSLLCQTGVNLGANLVSFGVWC